MDDKYEEYLVARFRQLGNSASKWAILFFIAIFYTWLSSIYPRAEYINSYVSETKKQYFFDSLSSAFRTTRRSFLRGQKDTLERYNAIGNSPLYDTAYTQTRNRYYGLVSTFRKAAKVKNDPERLKRLLQLKLILKGKERKKVKDTIKKGYLPIDVLISMSEFQKEEAKKQQDSLLNKMAITFSVPGLSPLSFGFRAGLAVWLLLSLTLLFYLFNTRLTMLRYLKGIYQALTLKPDSGTDKWSKTDLQVPIWFAPVYFKRDGHKETYRTLIGWKFTWLNNVFGVCTILTILVLQFYVAWLLWHVSVLPEFKNLWFQFISLTFVAVSLFIFLLWIQPIRFSSTFATDVHFDFRRREVLKLSASSLFFFLLAPALGKAVPLMRGTFSPSKRLKKLFKKKQKTDLADGFYLNKTKKGKVVHHFYQGYSFSLKTIPGDRQQLFFSGLMKIDIEKIIRAPDVSAYRIPYWPAVLEKDAYDKAIKADYISAVEILLFALSYSVSQGVQYTRLARPDKVRSTEGEKGVTALQNRITSFLVGLILRAEKQCSKDDIQHMWKLVDSRLQNDIPETVLRKDFITFYRGNEYYVRKWQTAKKLRWHLWVPKRRRRHHSKSISL